MGFTLKPSEMYGISEGWQSCYIWWFINSIILANFWASRMKSQPVWEILWLQKSTVYFVVYLVRRMVTLQCLCCSRRGRRGDASNRSPMRHPHYNKLWRGGKESSTNWSVTWFGIILGNGRQPCEFMKIPPFWKFSAILDELFSSLWFQEMQLIFWACHRNSSF